MFATNSYVYSGSKTGIGVLVLPDIGNNIYSNIEYSNINQVLLYVLTYHYTTTPYGTVLVTDQDIDTPYNYINQYYIIISYRGEGSINPVPGSSTWYHRSVSLRMGLGQERYTPNRTLLIIDTQLTVHSEPGVT